VNRIVIFIAVLFFVWYFMGQWMQRRRTTALIGALKEAIPAVGARPTIRWLGRSAFQVAVAEPAPPLTSVQVLCMLEARDFPLAQLYGRLVRDRRDQLLIRADLVRPPRPRELDVSQLGAHRADGRLKEESPHLEINLQVGAGQEGAIRSALELAAQVSRER
jgi:hypothetical protein